MRAFPNAPMSINRRKAGVAGSLMLRRPSVIQRVNQLCAERLARTQVTADWVLASLREIVLRCMQGVEVLDQEGKPTGVWKFDSKGATKALELLGKHTGALAGDQHLHLHQGDQNSFGVVMMPGFQDVQAPNLPPPEERTGIQKMVSAPRLARLPGKVQEAFLSMYGHNLGEQNGAPAEEGASST